MGEIFSAILKTGGGTLVSLIFGAIIVKIIAITGGPGEVGLFSLLRQTQQTAVVAATFAGTNALIQGISSSKSGKKENYIATVAWIFLAGGLLTVIAFVAFGSLLAGWILNRQDAVSSAMFQWLTVPILLAAASTYFMGMLNAYRALGKMAVAQAVAAGSGLLVVYPLATSGHSMAWVALLGVMGLGWAVASGGFAVGEGWLGLFRRGSLERGAFRHFFSIAGVILVISLVGTATVLAVRAMCAHEGGLAQSGIFDAAWTLSMMYLMLLLNSFGTYYLPVLSATPEGPARAALIQQVLLLCILLAVPLITGVIVLKPLIIHVFYSPNFTPTLKIMRWMLIGDYFKVTSWVLALPMIAFADMRRFFWSELAGNALLLAGAVWAILYQRQVEGVGMWFAVLYMLYLCYTAWYCTAICNVILDRRIWTTWLLGLGVILGASFTHWNKVNGEVLPAIAWITISFLVSYFLLRSNERREIIAVVTSTFRHA